MSKHGNLFLTIGGKFWKLGTEGYKGGCFK